MGAFFWGENTLKKCPISNKTRIFKKNLPKFFCPFVTNIWKDTVHIQLKIGDWIQTICIKNNLPIDRNGSLSLMSNDTDSRFLFLSLNTNEIYLPKQANDSGPRNVLTLYRLNIHLQYFFLKTIKGTSDPEILSPILF